MKKILNEWRKFLIKENSAPRMPYEPDNFGQLSLYHERDMNAHYFVLYHMAPYYGANEFYIVGMIIMKQTKKPCIPKTYEVSNIYVEKEVQSQGFGSMLYDIAFAIAEQNGFGLTSDHEMGTLDKAARLWDKVDDNPGYEKNTTKSGNDEFDYDNSTPDPDDDCNDGDGYPATDHSFTKKDNSAMISKYTQMIANHQKNEIFLDKIQLYDLENSLMNKAGSRFGELFSSAASRG